MAYFPAPGYVPMYNPPLPHSQPIPGGLRPGMSVYVQGTVPHHTKRFAVNFACGSKGSDIALHFNPRFDGKDKVVLNSFQGGKWGREEHKGMPLKMGEHFEVVFIVTGDKYEIRVNGNPFCEFMHRIPPERVMEVNADGDLQLQSMNLLGGGMMGGGGGYPQMGMPGMGPAAGGYPPSNIPGSMLPDSGYPSSNLPMMTTPASYHPQVPYFGSFPGGLGSKRTVVVRGFLPQNAKQFKINFKAGNNETVLHINPRLNERAVVRNSFLGGRWGSEEREVSFNPFEAGQYFDLSIRCGNQRFKVFANGQPFFNFNHRFHNFQQIDRMEIEGDVVLSYVQF